MKRIEMASQFLRVFFLLASVLSVVMYFAYFILKPGIPFELFGMTFGFKTDAILGVGKIFFQSDVLGLPSTAITAGLLFLMSRLFHQYAQYHFFTPRVIQHYAAIGILLILQVGVDLLDLFLQSKLTHSGSNFFSQISFFQLLTGLVILCISWIFSQALALQQVQDLNI